MQACLRRLRGHRVIWSRSWGYRMVWTRSQGYRVIWTRSLGYRMVWSRTLLMMMTIWSLACVYVYGSMCVDVYWYPACAESAAEVLTDDEEALQMCHDAKLKAELESFQGTHTQEEGLAEVGQKRPVPTPLRADLPLPKKLRRPPTRQAVSFHCLCAISSMCAIRCATLVNYLGSDQQERLLAAAKARITRMVAPKSRRKELEVPAFVAQHWQSGNKTEMGNLLMSCNFDKARFQLAMCCNSIMKLHHM